MYEKYLQIAAHVFILQWRITVQSHSWDTCIRLGYQQSLLDVEGRYRRAKSSLVLSNRRVGTEINNAYSTKLINKDFHDAPSCLRGRFVYFERWLPSATRHVASRGRQRVFG